VNPKKPTALAPKASADISGYNPEQVALIKSTIATGATDNELMLFLQVCKNHKLDPFTKQIHFVKRAGKGTIQVSIDGFRTIAERTGTYAGNDDPVFDNEEKPQKATVTVWKMVGAVRCPFTATARWLQYFPGEGQGFMWKKMPHLMLGKCAEALALRKAFPEALSGLYSDDEMQQSAPRDEEEPPVVDVPAPAPKQKAVKEEPTPTRVMEFLTACKTEQQLQTVYDQAFKHTWSAEDADTISECYLKAYQRVSGLKHAGEFMVDAQGVLVAVVSADATGKVTIEKSEPATAVKAAAAEQPAPPSTFSTLFKKPEESPEEASMEAAERAGMQADSAPGDGK
jgi:phage recombination protein Bet